MIDIKVGPAASFSEYSSIELLGMMVQSGQAPLEVYISNLPDNYVNNKQELLNMIQNNSQKQIQQLQQQIQQSQMVMQQMNDQYQKTQKDLENIDTIIQENARLKSMMADITAKIYEQDSSMAQRNQELTKDMQELIKAVTQKQ
jgi:TolA-binding protein